MFVLISGLFPRGVHKYMCRCLQLKVFDQDLLHGDNAGLYSVFGCGSKEYLIKAPSPRGQGHAIPRHVPYD